MGLLMGHLDGPGFGLRVALLPGLAACDAGTVGGYVDAGLEVVPRLRGPLEGHGHLDALLVAVDLHLLRVALEDDGVALIDDAHFGHLALVAFAQDLGLDGVVLHVGEPEEDLPALEELVLDGLDQGLVGAAG